MTYDTITSMPLSFDPIDEARRNWLDAGWDEADAMTAATSVMRAHQIVLSRVNEALAPLGLNFSRFEAVALLSFTRHGMLPLGKMGTRLQVHPTSVTNTIDRLERDGLVERIPHPTDRRTVLARLTEAGRDAATRGAALLAEIRFGLDGVDAAAPIDITDAIRRLRHAAGDF